MRNPRTRRTGAYRPDALQSINGSVDDGAPFSNHAVPRPLLDEHSERFQPLLVTRADSNEPDFGRNVDVASGHIARDGVGPGEPGLPDRFPGCDAQSNSIRDDSAFPTSRGGCWSKVGRGPRIALFALSVCAFLVVSAVALAPVIEAAFLRSSVSGVSVTLDGLRMGASLCAQTGECDNRTLSAVANYTLHHRETQRFPAFLRATATLAPLVAELRFLDAPCTDAIGTDAPCADAIGTDAIGTRVTALASFPAVTLDARDASTSVVAVPLRLTVADPGSFRALALAVFSEAGSVNVSVRANASVTVAGRFLWTVTETVNFATRVSAAGSGSLGGLPAESMRMVSCDNSSARATVVVPLRNPSRFSADLVSVGFDIDVLVPDARANGAAARGTNLRARALGTGHARSVAVPAGAVSRSEIDMVLTPASPDVSAAVMRAFLGGEDVLVESTVRLGPGAVALGAGGGGVVGFGGGVVVGVDDDGVGEDVPHGATNGPLAWALDGVRIASRISGGHGVGMVATDAAVVGGSPDSIAVNVTYTISNPTGFVTGTLSQVLLDVRYAGAFVGSSWVTDVPLPAGNNSFHQVIHMFPGHNRSVIAEIGHRYIESEPFYLTFAGSADRSAGPMSNFFSGWGDGLSVAGSPVPLVAEIAIAKFGVQLDPPAYRVDAVAVLHNPLPFALTMTGMRFSPFFNDTHGVHLGPLRLPPRDHIPMGDVVRVNQDVPLAPQANTSYATWLVRTDLDLATRLADSFLVRKDLFLDLDLGRVTVQWFNLTLPFAYHNLKVQNML